MKKPKKAYLVNKNELETIDYSEPQEDIFCRRKHIECSKQSFGF